MSCEHSEPKNTLIGLVKLDLICSELADRYDIITVSETLLSDNDCLDNLLIIDCQPTFILNRNCIGGGVLFWVRNHFCAVRKLQYEIEGLETLWFKINSNNN